MSDLPIPIVDLDELMNRDPLSLSTQDIDKIIAYQRRLRARKAAGEKIFSKPKAEIGDVMKNLLDKVKPEPPKIDRKF